MKPARSSTAWTGARFIAAWLFLTAARLGARDALAGDFSKPAEIGKRLEAARAELRGLPADADPARRERLQQLEAICQFHLTSGEVVARAREARDKAALAVKAWRGFPQPPPYSILAHDEVRENLATLDDLRSAGEAQLRIVTTQIEAARDKLDGHQQAERQFAEEADSAATPEAKRNAESSVEIEKIASRVTAEEIGRLTRRQEAQLAELEMVQAKSELAGLELKAIEGKTAFVQKDLDGILQRVASERATVIAALTAAGRPPQAPDPLLAWKTEFLDLEKEFWETRFAASNKPDAAARKQALAELGELKQRTDDWAEVARLRLAVDSSGAVDLDPVRMREGLVQVGRMQRRIGFAIAELEGSHLKTPVLDAVGSRLRALWDAELYLAEETEVVDGKKISTYRAVTLGKLARLALIFTVGWLLLRFLSRRVRGMVAARSKISPATADLAAKWAFGIGLALLVIYGLNTVRIPLTVFAFLGGALAIGVGFGTQTILKNFISGLILLFERPLKVGDQVEVDGVIGTIRSIGMRASVIQHGNGIDTVIPNSNLLENQVTNWTLKDTRLRHSVAVNIDYGAPTREVAKTLLAVAAEHGLVLDEPAPEVRFEDFGEKALVFRLFYWFDLKRTSRDALSSDLRFMIEKAFTEAGIPIAGPQRDIQFDREAPLRVELARPAKSAGE